MSQPPDLPGPPSLLLIDDDPGYRHVLSRALSRRGYEVLCAAEPVEALAQAARQTPAYIILDLNLAGSSGLTLIEPLHARCPRARILILTGYASIPTAVQAIKLGAHQYLAKPAEVADILQALTGDAPRPDEPPETGVRMSVARLEWEYIQRVLAEHHGNIAATARALRMHRRTLQRKLAKRPRTD